MGRHKYQAYVLVVEDDAFFGKEILKTMQRAFKRKVLVRTAPSLAWGLKMEGVPDILIVDVVSAEDASQVIQHVAEAALQYLKKYPLVRIGLMGFWADQMVKEVRKVMPAVDRVEALSGPCLRLTMEEFVSKHVKGGTACST